MLDQITRVSHVRKLCDKAGWKDRKQAIRELMYRANITRNTAEKAYEGSTELDLDTVEKLAAAFKVSKDSVLESRFGLE